MLDDSFPVSEDGGDLRKPGIHQDFFRFFTLTDNISTEGIQVDCITPTLSKQNGIFLKIISFSNLEFTEEIPWNKIERVNREVVGYELSLFHF